MVLWELKNRGYAEKTVEGYSQRLKILARYIDLNSPERVEASLVDQSDWSNAYKESCINVYSRTFVTLRYMGHDSCILARYNKTNSVLNCFSEIMDLVFWRPSSLEITLLKKL